MLLLIMFINFSLIQISCPGIEFCVCRFREDFIREALTSYCIFKTAKLSTDEVPYLTFL